MVRSIEVLILLALYLLSGCVSKSGNEESGESCKRHDTTSSYKRHCSGYWHTMTYDGKIYNCLPQVDYGGKMYEDDICYQGEKFVCHVNSEEITKLKIEKSCELNREIEELHKFNEFSIPKRIPKQ